MHQRPVHSDSCTNAGCVTHRRDAIYGRDGAGWSRTVAEFRYGDLALKKSTRFFSNVVNSVVQQAPSLVIIWTVTLEFRPKSSVSLYGAGVD